MKSLGIETLNQVHSQTRSWWGPEGVGREAGGDFSGRWEILRYSTRILILFHKFFKVKGEILLWGTSSKPLWLQTCTKNRNIDIWICSLLDVYLTSLTHTITSGSVNSRTAQNPLTLRVEMTGRNVGVAGEGLWRLRAFGSSNRDGSGRRIGEDEQVSKVWDSMTMMKFWTSEDRARKDVYSLRNQDFHISLHVFMHKQVDLLPSYYQNVLDGYPSFPLIGATLSL